MVVRHSQSAQVPDCPTGMVKLWDGYSLLMMQGNDHGYHQDLGNEMILFAKLNIKTQFFTLGSAGSCLQKFSALPYLRCDHTNVCYYGQTNDLTYYLSTTEPMPMMPVQREQIRPYISRCAVCEAPANVMSFHSLSMTPPPCPNGWNILWQGYSFVMVSSNRLLKRE
jgi:collagen type IV alpha